MVIEGEILEAFLKDPVMAAWVIMGVELDDFQRYRLRIYWFAPDKIDSSGWGTGKTIVDFVYVNLRCTLLPNHRAGVYFPVWSIGQSEFWDYYKTIDNPLFISQFLPLKKQGGGEKLGSGCWHRYWRNGSELQLPAPGMAKDGQTQVSRSFNTVVIEEYTRTAEMGEAIDELMARARRESFNMNHPVWANHIMMSAHAEGPEHPAYKLYKAYRDIIAGKHTALETQRTALISFCYLDWSPESAKKWRHDNLITKQKRTLSRDEFRKKYLGIWTRSGKGFYPSNILSKVLRSALLPSLWRRSEQEYFFNGTDIAPGQSLKADSSCFVDWRVAEVPAHSTDEVTIFIAGKPWHVSPVFAHFLKDVDGPQVSGFIHGRHLAMGFTSITIDMGAGGGGPWVYKELIKPKQLIHNVQRTVVPLCSKTEPNQHDKQPIVLFFKRGSEFDILFDEKYMADDGGYVEAAHLAYRETWEAQELRWPMIKAERSAPELNQLDEQHSWALGALDLCFEQTTQIRVKSTADGYPVLSKRGFRHFEAPKKKDGAYAAFYGFMGIKRFFYDMEHGEHQGSEEDAFVGG